MRPRRVRAGIDVTESGTTRPGLDGEFRRRVALAEIEAKSRAVEIAADAGERAAVARRFGVKAIGRLSASVRLNRVDGGAMIRLRAKLVADVVLTCVVTLEGFAAHIEDTVDVRFAPGAKTPDDIEVASDGDDAPEPLDGDEIDIGDVIAEHLGLNLDPYPRRAGVVFSADGAGGQDNGGAASESPFATLRDLKTTV